MVNARQATAFAMAVTVVALAQTPCHAQRGKALTAVLKMAAGGTAAYSAGKAKHSSEVFDKARRDAASTATDVARAKAKEAEFESQVLCELRGQGLDASQDAIYSVYFTLNNDASAVYWADTFSKPDVFFYFDLEGHGSYLVPQIRNEYAGAPVLDRVIAREVRPGSKIVVRVLDDDTWSDEVWKSLLRTQVNVDVTGGLQATKLASVQARASGQLQVLSSNAQVVLDPPDEIAAVTTTVPASEDGTWLAEGDLRDGTNRTVGSIQIACVWSARGERAAFEAKVAAEAGGNFWFWAVAGGLAAPWFVVHVIRGASGGKSPSSSTAERGAAADGGA